MKINLTGYLSGARDDRDEQFGLAPPDYDLPAKVDYRNLMLPVEHQDGSNACVGFAGSAVCEYWEWKKTGYRVNLSATMGYHKAKECDEYQGVDYEGTSIRGFCKAVAKYGICEDKFWMFGKTPQEGYQKNALQRNEIVYRNLALNKSLLIPTIKRALHEYAPVVVGLWVYRNWTEVKDDGHIPEGGEQKTGGHAMVIVGYQEDEFILRNSWGINWGENGYGYFSKEYLEQNCDSAWLIQDFS